AAERLEVPDDLAAAFEIRPPAAVNFAAFPPSARKMLLGWVAVAQRPETRSARIEKIAEAAARNERARG
ncbi:MAG TPA: YdeI/OmpD-associated family protein, partial [Candidatus Limnocylindrales bacterium]|nr:YdeI/OmpD-associated family protein [Candidatus Limnocylindrales bacterium]